VQRDEQDPAARVELAAGGPKLAHPDLGELDARGWIRSSLCTMRCICTRRPRWCERRGDDAREDEGERPLEGPRELAPQPCAEHVPIVDG